MKATAARLFAKNAHGDQMYGTVPYIEHLDAAANVLREFGNFDDELLAAAYLHDVIEDAHVSDTELEIHFGGEIALLVSLVTDQAGGNRAERHAKIYPGIALHPKAVSLKLADRIANVRASTLNNPGLLEMYRREYPDFKRYLQGEHHQAMWRELDRLLAVAL